MSRRLAPFVTAAVVTAGSLLTANAGLAHGTSKSFADWRVDGRRAEVTVALAAHDVAAAVSGLDADGDGALSATELAQAAPQLGDRLAAQVHAQVAPGGAACPSVQSRLRGLGDPVEEIQLTSTLECPARITALQARVGLLPELEPAHVNVSTFTGRGLDATHVFTPLEPSVTVRVEPAPLSTLVTAALSEWSRHLSRPASALLVLALLLLAGARGAALRAAIFGLGATLTAGLVAPDLLAVFSGLLLVGAAVELVHARPHIARGLLWALGAGAVAGWGARVGRGDEPVVVVAVTVVMVGAYVSVSAVVGALAGQWPQASRDTPRRAAAVVLGGASAVLLVLAIAT